MDELRSAIARDDLEATLASLAADERPSMTPERLGLELDRLADRIAPYVRAVELPRRLGRLVYGMFLRLGFRTPETYGDPELHLVDRVIARREGSPVALAAVLIALGRRFDVPLAGVAFPGHFMVRYEAASPVFIDPSSGAFPFPADSLLSLAAEALRVRPEDGERFLAPVSTRTLAVRLLQNLQRAYEERGDRGRSMLVLDRLYEITGSPIARCDRGLRAAALGAPHAAADDLAAYLVDHRDADVARTLARLERGPLSLN